MHHTRHHKGRRIRQHPKKAAGTVPVAAGRRTLALLPVILLLTLLASCSNQAAYPPPAVSGKEVTVAINSLEPGIPRFFTYQYGERNINFFILKVNGEVQSYFDACEKCNPKKLGYRFEKGHLICRACNVGYPADRLQGLGSCSPIPLKGETRDSEYVITARDISSGAVYF